MKRLVLVVVLFAAACRPAPSPAPAARAAGTTPVFGNAIPSSGARTNAITELAQFDAPEYTPPPRADSETPGQFLFGNAMEFYRSRDYGEAANGLRLMIERTGESPGAYFYLGIAYLQSAQTQLGVASLQRLLELNDPAYEEDARFFLGKALLHAGDVPGARAELERAAAIKGARAAEAARLVAAIDLLPPDAARR
jgi:TolA-binding protein